MQIPSLRRFFDEIQLSLKTPANLLLMIVGIVCILWVSGLIVPHPLMATDDWKISFETLLNLLATSLIAYAIFYKQSNAHMADLSCHLVIHKNKLRVKIKNDSTHNYARDVKVFIFTSSKNVHPNGPSSPQTDANDEDPFVLYHSTDDVEVRRVDIDTILSNGSFSIFDLVGVPDSSMLALKFEIQSANSSVIIHQYSVRFEDGKPVQVVNIE